MVSLLNLNRIVLLNRSNLPSEFVFLGLHGLLELCLDPVFLSLEVICLLLFLFSNGSLLKVLPLVVLGQVMQLLQALLVLSVLLVQQDQALLGYSCLGDHLGIGLLLSLFLSHCELCHLRSLYLAVTDTGLRARLFI